ncbi:MAG: ABC transporter permease [Gemmataceae bacterium]|nr:ABC transporter permease [Gemmataceae bacterium]
MRRNWASFWMYLLGIWRLRYFWLSLVRNDLNNRYSRSFLGIGWSLVRPLAMTAVFCVVFAHLFQVNWREYAPFVLLGLTVWQFLTETILNGCDAFTRAAPYIRQQCVPMAIFPLRTVLGAGFHAIIALGLAVVLVWWVKGIDVAVVVCSLVPAVVLLFFLGWFLAIVCGVLHTHFYDTRHILEIGLQIMFYLTPILYHPDSLPEQRHLLWWLEWNPLTAVLEIVRRPVLWGEWPLLVHYQMSLVLLGSAAALAVWSLRRRQRTLVFWI